MESMKALIAAVTFISVFCYGAMQDERPDTSAFYPIDKLARETGSSADTKTVLISDLSDSNIFILKDESITISIDKRYGSISKVEQTSDSGLLSGSIINLYALQYANGKDAAATEQDDRVIDIQFEAKHNSLRLICSNSKLPGLTFTKTYTLTKGLLAKDVKVSSKSPTPSLLFVESKMLPATLNCINGPVYGFDAAPGYFPEDHENIFDMVNWGPAGTRMHPVFVHADKGLSIGFYTHTINGRFINARRNDGWQRDGQFLRGTIMAGGFVGKDKALEYEFHLRVVKGDALDFYRAYQDLPGYQKLFGDQSDPEWMDRVRYVTDCGAFDLLQNWTPKDKLPDITPFQKTNGPNPWRIMDFALGNDERNVGLFTFFGWGNLGGLPTEGTWFTYEAPGVRENNVQGVRWCIEQRQAPGNRVKFALYDWNNSFDPKSEPYASHPGMGVVGRDGKNVKSFFYGLAPWWPVDALPNCLNEDYRKFYLGQVGKLQKIYGISAYYIDAEVPDRCADWKTYTFLQPYDRNDFKKAYRWASGKELPLIKNSPNEPYVSGGYWEGRGLWTKDMEKRWRAVGMKMLQEKIWQWKHRWTALLKWTGPINTEPYYTNYIVGMGFKPHAPDEPVRKAAYIQAAFEMRHLELLDAKFSPCFWRNEKTDTEVYLLRQGQAVYATCIGHATENKKITIKIDGKGLPFPEGTPLFLWQIQLDSGDKMPEELNKQYEQIVKVGGDVTANLLKNKELIAAWLKRPIAHTKYMGQVVQNQSLDVQVEVRPKLLTMAVISPLPVLVISENCEPSQMQVPGTADVKLNGQFKADEKQLQLKVDCDRVCKLAFLCPDGLKIQKITLNTKDISSTEVTIGQRKYQAVEIPYTGKISDIDVKYLQAE